MWLTLVQSPFPASISQVWPKAQSQESHLSTTGYDSPKQNETQTKRKKGSNSIPEDIARSRPETLLGVPPQNIKQNNVTTLSQCAYFNNIFNFTNYKLLYHYKLISNTVSGRQKSYFDHFLKTKRKITSGNTLYYVWDLTEYFIFDLWECSCHVIRRSSCTCYHFITNCYFILVIHQLRAI